MHPTLKVAITLMLLTVASLVHGQISSIEQPDFSMRVHAGEAVPDMVFGHVESWNNKPVRFSDFKGKLLILDFWTTNCAPCIGAMPKMEEIQKLFPDKIQVILVTRNTKAAVASLTQRSKILQRNTLPTITNDTLLEKLFPYTGTPTHVWIGKDGKLLFVTGGYNTTAETIQKYLNGATLGFTNEESQPGIIPDIGVAINQSENLGLRCYSLFTGKSDVTTQTLLSFIWDTANKVIGYKAINTDLYGLLTAPFMTDNESYDNGLYLPNRVVWNVKNKYQYIAPDDKSLGDAWRNQYLYCYELKLPRVAKAEELYRYLAADLKRFFGLTTKLENRKTKCLVLVRTSNQDKIKTKGGKHFFYAQEDYSAFEGVNIKPSEFIIHTFGEVNIQSPLPVVDGTKYNGEIDLNINADLHNLSAVRKELYKYDLDIVEREETIPMIVITGEK